jgi:hypothetical protein
MVCKRLYVVYQLQTVRPPYALHNARVTICLDLDGKVVIFHKQIR